MATRHEGGGSAENGMPTQHVNVSSHSTPPASQAADHEALRITQFPVHVPVSPQPSDAADASTWSSRHLAPTPNHHETGQLHHKQLPTTVPSQAVDHLQRSNPDMTFFQKYFTKPRLVTPTSASLPKDREKNSPPEQPVQVESRVFSPLSLGFLVLLAIMLIVLFGVIAAVVAVTVDRNHRERVSGNGTEILPQHHKSPIRRAIPSNFPDPAILYANGTWYAFATNNAAGVLAQGNSNATEYTVDYGRANVQMATSTDFLDWTLASLPDQPLPTTGDWTHNVEDGKVVVPDVSFTWAPAVIQRDDGKYVMYYADRPKGQSPYRHWVNPHHPFPHCIGAAVSETASPAGPYRAQNDSLACPMLQGGAIDPEAIRDVDGTIYLTYKVDGNNIGAGGECGNTEGDIVPTPILLQKMSPNALTPDGDPVEILHNIPSDGPLVEAPMLVRSHEGIYFLFFSSGCTRLNSYTTRYATARQIHGPYLRAQHSLLQTGDWGLVAPGSIGIFENGHGGFNLAFHARVPFGRVGKVRAMFTSSLVFEGDKVRLVNDDGGNNRTVSLEQKKKKKRRRRRKK